MSKQAWKSGLPPANGNLPLCFHILFMDAMHPS